MNSNIIIAIIGLIATVIGSSAAYFFARKKNNAEAKRTELDSVEKAVTIWRQLAEDLSQKVSALQVEVDKLRVENNRLNSEIEQLRELVQHEKH